MTKYKVNINRPKISTEEIVQQKDFNIVWKKYKKERRATLKMNWAAITLILLVMLFIIFFAVRIIGDIQDRKKEQKESILIEVKSNEH